jgi:hypothetical protein
MTTLPLTLMEIANGMDRREYAAAAAADAV